ncbi:BolA family protein [Amphritea pacifica]|uniref:BolA/IbaG family iron-sulfur metabolism protein n=1 Tax=Amphritea pacifica TaxID=2811233 RepID=A0ABS2WDE4_9GAMM|nr:BolA/IbaG family iron-sulfur metabolism protein [Amphritea pacifica]MBN0989735.1 BolA/IbaG family iron-sulfur metabolism protein [Amphritea pacifica]MBN1007404.1 BolA/IbaG family iron-sulfur metabolism protein [Amphritea pacifica]
MMNTEQITQIIVAAIPDAELDISGEDCNFTVRVISESFADMKPLERQKRVLNLFQQQLKTGELHALTVKAYTMQQFIDLQNQFLVQLDND